jgi:hypothetical protein
MALLFAHGVIPWLAASVATTTYAITCTDVTTGQTFSPKAIRCYWFGLGGGVDAASQAVHQRAGMGFAVSASNRGNVSVLDQDAAGTQICENYNSTDAIATTLSGAGAVDGALDISSFDAAGFTAIVDDQVPVDLDVFYEAWGGDGVQEAQIVTISEPAATGTVNYETGFRPSVVFFATRLGTTTGTLQADSSVFAVGASTGPASAENIVVFGFSDDGSAAQRRMYQQHDRGGRDHGERPSGGLRVQRQQLHTELDRSHHEQPQDDGAGHLWRAVAGRVVHD